MVQGVQLAAGHGYLRPPRNTGQELYMHSIYVDDNNMEALPLGTRLEGQVFVAKEELVRRV